jgi:hypothetical protein
LEDEGRANGTDGIDVATVSHALLLAMNDEGDDNAAADTDTDDDDSVSGFDGSSGAVDLRVDSLPLLLLLMEFTVVAVDDCCFRLLYAGIGPTANDDNVGTVAVAEVDGVDTDGDDEELDMFCMEVGLTLPKSLRRSRSRSRRLVVAPRSSCAVHSVEKSVNESRRIAAVSLPLPLPLPLRS